MRCRADTPWLVSQSSRKKGRKTGRSCCRGKVQSRTGRRIGRNKSNRATGIKDIFPAVRSRKKDRRLDSCRWRGRGRKGRGRRGSGGSSGRPNSLKDRTSTPKRQNWHRSKKDKSIHNCYPIGTIPLGRKCSWLSSQRRSGRMRRRQRRQSRCFKSNTPRDTLPDTASCDRPSRPDS